MKLRRQLDRWNCCALASLLLADLHAQQQQQLGGAASVSDDDVCRVLDTDSPALAKRYHASAADALGAEPYSRDDQISMCRFVSSAGLIKFVQGQAILRGNLLDSTHIEELIKAMVEGHPSEVTPTPAAAVSLHFAGHILTIFKCKQMGVTKFEVLDDLPRVWPKEDEEEASGIAPRLGATRVRVCASVCVHACVCTSVCASVCVHQCVCMRVCASVCVYQWVCDLLFLFNCAACVIVSDCFAFVLGLLC
jgi:hypothetical protein